jgi:hypothetical protein
METKTQFELDWYKPMRINTMESNRGYYNLVLTIRDLSLYTKVGLKPHRHWRLKDVKQYFGITGSAASMLTRLQAFKNNEL